MNKFTIACKAFIKGWKFPDLALVFLEDSFSLPQKETKSDLSHLRLLRMLQNSGRLVDFLKEDISTFSDEEVGSAARKIHQDCSKVVEEFVTLRPIRQEEEGSSITVPVGYDANEIKLVGNVKGDPPYKGVLVHKGWMAHKHSLPKATTSTTPIINPAEVEIR